MEGGGGRGHLLGFAPCFAMHHSIEDRSVFPELQLSSHLDYEEAELLPALNAYGNRL